MVSGPGWPRVEVGPVLVQRVLMPGSGRESWTLLGEDGEVVEPAERYLAYLAAIERSPNTVRAYAVSLKLWFEFLQLAGTRWDQAGGAHGRAPGGPAAGPRRRHGARTRHALPARTGRRGLHRRHRR